MNDLDSWHILAFHLPPDISSLGYFSLKIANLLRQGKKQVHLWTLEERTLKTSRENPGLNVHSYNPQKFKESLKSKSKNKIMLFYEPNSHIDLYKNFLDIYKSHQGQIPLYLVLHKSLEKAYRIKKIYPFLSYLKEKYFFKKLLKEVQTLFVTAPYLEEKIKSSYAKNRPLDIHWLPLQSNIHFFKNDRGSDNIRKAFAPESQSLIGNFASYKDSYQKKKLVKFIVFLLQDHPERFFLCLGRNSAHFVDKFKKLYPNLENQIESTGELDYKAVSSHIQACDIMLQVYSKGVTTKHTSLLTCLSHGKAVIATKGPRTEAFWVTQNCMALYDENSDLDFVQKFENVIYDSSTKKALEKKALETYNQCFSPNRTIKKILSL